MTPMVESAAISMGGDKHGWRACGYSPEAPTPRRVVTASMCWSGSARLRRGARSPTDGSLHDDTLSQHNQLLEIERQNPGATNELRPPLPTKRHPSKRGSSTISKFPVFSGLLRISELFLDTCNPILSIKPDQVPLLGAMGAVGQIATCHQAKPLIFLRLQSASPAFDDLQHALASRLPRPCYAHVGSALSPGMAVWGDAFSLVGIVDGQTASDGFTVFLERRNTGPSADPEGEASLRQDIEANVPASCR